MASRAANLLPPRYFVAVRACSHRRLIFVVLTLTACSPELSLELTQSAVGPVLDAHWTGPDAQASWVEFTDGERTLRTPAQATGEALTAPLVGFTQLTDISARVVTEAGEAGPWLTMESGLLPANLPLFELVSRSEEASVDWLLLPVFGTRNAVVMLNGEGRVVWYRGLPEGFGSLTALQLEGAGDVLHNVVDGEHNVAVNTLSQVSLSGELVDELALPGSHHTFTRRADGTLAWLQIDVRDTQEWGPVVGDEVWVQPPGEEARMLFSAWDHLEVDVDPALDASFYHQGLDWTHANGLSWDEDRQSWWLTLRGVDRVLELDPDSGEPLLSLGPGGEWDFENAADGFGGPTGPHSARPSGQGTLLVFDNDGEEANSPSRVVEYRLDPASQTAKLVRAIQGRRSAAVMGQALRLDNGATLCTWGSTGLVTEVNRQNEVLWELSAPIGSLIGYAQVLNSPNGTSER